jgi:hypothetical protein
VFFRLGIGPSLYLSLAFTLHSRATGYEASRKDRRTRRTRIGSQPERLRCRPERYALRDALVRPGTVYRSGEADILSFQFSVMTWRGLMVPFRELYCRPFTEETLVVSLSVMFSLVTQTPAENYPSLSLIDFRTTLLTLTTLVRTAKATTTKTCLWAIEDWL